MMTNDVQDSVNGRSICQAGTYVIQTNDAFGIDRHVAAKLPSVSRRSLQFPAA